MDKKSLILKHIIEEYLRSKEPISSKQLVDVLEIKISSASIRGYLNKLSEDGHLDQLHVSSGRVPTFSSLQNYWANHLYNHKPLYVSEREIETKAEQAGLFYMFSYDLPNKLLDVVNIDNTFILAIFENMRLAFDYSNATYKFLSEFRLLDASEVASIAKSVGALEIAKKITFQLRYFYTMGGVSNLIEMNFDEELLKSFLNFEVFSKLENGIYFEGFLPNGIMGYKNDVVIDQKEAKLLCVGATNRNFGYFLNKY